MVEWFSFINGFIKNSYVRNIVCIISYVNLSKQEKKWKQIEFFANINENRKWKCQTFLQACLYLDNFENATSTINKENSEKKKLELNNWGLSQGFRRKLV